MFCFDPTVDWSTIVQILGFLGAIWAVFYQFKAQRQLQAENHRVGLQFQTYEKVAANIEGASPTGVATSFNILLAALEKAKDRLEQSGQYVPPPFRTEEMHEQFKSVHTALWRVVATIEKYEVVAPNLTLFREALAKKVRGLGDAYAPLIQRLPYLLMSENGINSASQLVVLRGEEAADFAAMVDRFMNVSYDVAGFLYDIQVELQNELLSPFFDRKLPVRAPADKDVLVLTSSDRGMLTRVEGYVRG